VGGTRSEVTTPHELDEDPPGLEPEDFSTVVENWSNGYHRDCAICGKQVVGARKAFAAHVLERHQVTLTEYANQHGDKEDRADSHTCHLCNELVQHDYEVLKGHVEKHGINIEHYYHKFIVSTNSDATNAEIIISKVSLGVSPPSSKAPVSGPVPIKVRKNHWANGCSYQCILCKGQKYPEEFMFKKHILTAHNMSTEEYQNNFGDPALVKQLHICKVCNKDIKHEYTAILNHLRVKHNMTLTEYSQNYMRTPGSMGLPPTTSSPSSQTNLSFHTASEAGGNSEESGEFYIVYPELEQK